MAARRADKSAAAARRRQVCAVQSRRGLRKHDGLGERFWFSPCKGGGKTASTGMPPIRNQKSESENPKPLTLYTSALTAAQAAKLRALLEDEGYKFEPKPYTLYYAVKDKLNVAVYEKGP